MKFLTIFLLVSLVGCAGQSTGHYVMFSEQAISYEQMAAIKINDNDCINIKNIIDEVDRQLKLKGLTNRNPEDMTPEDRKYNSKARIIIWSLRIGCNNPNRYATK